jgi:hypothetical protein
MCEEAARNFCRKGTEMPQKTRKKQEKAGEKQEKSKRNSFHRWTQINADVQKIKMFLSVFICG